MLSDENVERIVSKLCQMKEQPWKLVKWFQYKMKVLLVQSLLKSWLEFEKMLTLCQKNSSSHKFRPICAMIGRENIKTLTWTISEMV